MAYSVNDALHHLDALLSAEAAGHLTEDELLLVTDMVVGKLVGSSGTAAGQLLSTPAGSNLAAQIGQMLPGAMQEMQLQQQSQHQPQQMQRPSGAALTAGNLQRQGQGQRTQAAHPAFCSHLVLSAQPDLRTSAQGTNASELASPSDSSISGRSSPVSPQSRPLARFPVAQQHHPSSPMPAPRPPPATPAAAAPVPDAAVQAAADVLTAALTDPNASIDEIVGIFDQVLSAGERDAKELQQRLAAPPSQLPQPQQQQLSAPVHHPVHQVQPFSTAQPPQAQPYLAAPQQQQLSHPMQSYQQQQQTFAEQQTFVQQQSGPWSPLLAAGSKQSAISAYLQEQQQSSPHDQQQPGPMSPWQPAGSPPAARNLPAQAPAQLQSTSRLSMAASTDVEWHPDMRPGTVPAAHSACGSQFSRSQGGASPNLHMSSQSLAALSSSPSAAMRAAAAARRSQSPDVFKRLSAMSTASATARQSAVKEPPRNSTSPLEVERNWLGTLRDSRSSERTSPPTREHSSRSCSRDSSPARTLQQLPAQEVPWLTAASVQSARQSTATGPMEWDAETRSIKAGSAGGWAKSVNSKGGASEAGQQQQQEQAQEGPAKQPIKLPAHVIEERMRRFYARNVDWKNRCAQVYERQREQQQLGETEGCTFAPAINKKSDKIAQELRTSYPMRPIRPITPLADAAEEVGKHLQQQRRSASTGKARQKQQQGPHSWLYGSMGSSNASPGATDGGSALDQSMPPAAKRLFQDAFVRMQRAEQTKEVTELAERKARSWSAPRRLAAEGVPARVYDHLDPGRSSSKHNQKHSGDEECLFKPWTNPRRKPRSPGATAGVQDVQSAADEVLAEFEAMLDGTCAEQQAQQHEQQQQQPQARPGTAPASGGGQQSQQARSPSAGRRIGSVTKNADLDWGEFIERQTRFISVRQAKVVAVAEREYSANNPSPELSPGTKRILKGKQALAANAADSSDSPGSPQKQAQHDFLGRLQQESDLHACSSGGCGSSPMDSATAARRAVQASSGGGASSGRGVSSGGASSAATSSSGWTSDEYTFKPHITPKAAAKKGRSFEEMSEGDRLRREVRLEQLRVVKEAKELAAATFRPDLSPSRQRAGESFAAVPPKLSLTSEGLSAYMASLQEKRRHLEERRKRAQARKQEEELRECTFKPETTPVPAYITEMAEVGYTARYLDKVMQGALTDARVGSMVAAVAKALKPASDGGGGAQKGKGPSAGGSSSPEKPAQAAAAAAAASSKKSPEQPLLIRAKY